MAINVYCAFCRAAAQGRQMKNMPLVSPRPLSIRVTTVNSLIKPPEQILLPGLFNDVIHNVPANLAPLWISQLSGLNARMAFLSAEPPMMGKVRYRSACIRFIKLSSLPQEYQWMFSGQPLIPSAIKDLSKCAVE
jgi:hypothetical protein